MKRTVILLIVVISAANAQLIGFGPCPQTSIIEDFDVSQYMGKWYEIAKIPQIFQNGDCTEANYGPVDEFGQVKVLNKEVQGDRVVAVRGVAKQKRINRSDLQVYLQVPIVGLQQSNYDVLATDYQNYSLVYACKAIFGFVKFEFTWILSRTRTLSPEATALIDRVMTNNNLDKSALRVTKQDSCPNLDTLPYTLIA